MKTETIQAAINAIRKIEQFNESDIADIVADLSCTIAASRNSHLRIHQVSIDSLDDLSNYIQDWINTL